MTRTKTTEAAENYESGNPVRKSMYEGMTEDDREQAHICDGYMQTATGMHSTIGIGIDTIGIGIATH